MFTNTHICAHTHTHTQNTFINFLCLFQLLGVLVQLMELQLEVFGSGFKEDKVWDAIMEMRKQISVCRSKKLELEAVFSSAEKALQASGEAAHITGDKLFILAFISGQKT